MEFTISQNSADLAMLSVKKLRKTFRDATDASSIEFVYDVNLAVERCRLTKDGDVIMSTIKQMECEEVFLSALGRCWSGFDIFEKDPLEYQIYTYEVRFGRGILCKAMQRRRRVLLWKVSGRWYRQP